MMSLHGAAFSSKNYDDSSPTSILHSLSPNPSLTLPFLNFSISISQGELVKSINKLMHTHTHFGYLSSHFDSCEDVNPFSHLLCYIFANDAIFHTGASEPIFYSCVPFLASALVQVGTHGPSEGVQ